MVSIIIRTKNEERWIGQCLKRIKNQTWKDWEVILVDNKSTDMTVAKAKSVLPSITVSHVSDYIPGDALNRGISLSKREYVVCLSAHCLPINEHWLAALINNMDDPKVAGVYGRQVPMSFTPPQDKRDLLNTFGLDRRVQIKDSFFHNANSLIRRSVWERFPFDGKASNIEDRLWARRVLNAGFSLIYEPMSQVYHHHGIHQNGRKERCQGVTRILESIFPTESPTGTDLPMESHDALAVIVLQTGAASDAVFDEDLLESTFKSIQESRFIKQIVFAVDDPALGKLGCRWNSEVIIRPAELSKFGVRADEVLSFVLKELAKQGRYPEIVVPLEITYPFRPPGLIDALVEKLVTEGLDTVIAGNPEFRPCWNNTTDGLLRVDQSQGPRSVRDPLLIGLPNLGCATRPSNLHRGTRLGGNLGIVEVPHPLCSMEIRNASDLKLYKTLRLANISLNYNEAPITSAFCAVHEKQNLQ